MGVYLDTARNRLGRMIMCHMIADTPSELHGMAEFIGLKREWFQLLSFPHYDVSLSRKEIAVGRGVIILERREFHLKMKEIKLAIIAAKGKSGW